MTLDQVLGLDEVCMIKSYRTGQGRRNLGGRGGQAPKFCQVPFFREQSALFLREKLSLRFAFFAQRALLKT